MGAVSIVGDLIVAWTYFPEGKLGTGTDLQFMAFGIIKMRTIIKNTLAFGRGQVMAYVVFGIKIKCFV